MKRNVKLFGLCAFLISSALIISFSTLAFMFTVNKGEIVRDLAGTVLGFGFFVFFIASVFLIIEMIKKEK